MKSTANSFHLRVYTLGFYQQTYTVFKGDLMNNFPLNGSVSSDSVLGFLSQTCKLGPGSLCSIVYAQHEVMLNNFHLKYHTLGYHPET